jgi:hypothetical protein
MNSFDSMVVYVFNSIFSKVTFDLKSTIKFVLESNSIIIFLILFLLSIKKNIPWLTFKFLKLKILLIELIISNFLLLLILKLFKIWENVWPFLTWKKIYLNLF